MPAVTAIASAPQKVTRSVGRSVGAARPRAEIAEEGEEGEGPRGHDRNEHRRRRDDHEEEARQRRPRRSLRGQGEGRLDRPGGGDLRDAELVAGAGGERILRHQLPGHLACEGGVEARGLRTRRRVRRRASASGSPASSRRSRSRSAFSVSDCEETDTIRAAIDIAPATSPATAVRITVPAGGRRRTRRPRTRLAVEMMPSFAPRTAALSQPIRR